MGTLFQVCTKLFRASKRCWWCTLWCTQKIKQLTMSTFPPNNHKTQSDTMCGQILSKFPLPTWDSITQLCITSYGWLPWWQPWFRHSKNCPHWGILITTFTNKLISQYSSWNAWSRRIERSGNCLWWWCINFGTRCIWTPSYSQVWGVSYQALHGRLTMCHSECDLLLWQHE